MKGSMHYFDRTADDKKLMIWLGKSTDKGPIAILTDQ